MPVRLPVFGAESQPWGLVAVALGEVAGEVGGLDVAGVFGEFGVGVAGEDVVGLEGSGVGVFELVVDGLAADSTGEPLRPLGFDEFPPASAGASD